MLNGQEIKRRREALTLTQAEASKRAGFSTSQQWSNLEQGQIDDPQASTLHAIARVLGCKMEQLLTDRNNERTEPTTRSANQDHSKG